MIIQHNIMAINSHRQLGINNTNLGKNLEKLSSGYRINRAADDAAGLAISEKMRAQITGLDRAILNAQDGASLIQTAEGALQEVHSMLNRMVELATQSANGTYQADDRQKIEAEVEALKEEIDRISKATNFNGIQLLDGSLSSSAPKDVKVEGVKVSETAAVAGVYGYTAAGVTDLKTGDEVSFTVGLNNGDSVTVKFTMNDDLNTMTADDGTVITLATTATTGATSNSMTAADVVDALETQLRKTSLQNDFIIDMKGTSGIDFTSRVAGTKSPQITGISYTKNDDPAVQLTQTTATASTTDEYVAPEDEIRTIKSSSFVLFTPSSGATKSNENIATFTVNGEKFVLVDAKALSSGGDYAKAVADLQNRGVHIINVASSGNLTSNDLMHIAADINQKTGMAFEFNGKTGAEMGITILAPKIGNGLTMQVGDTADDFNKITVSVDDMSAAGLGISNISMATQEASSRALDRVKSAIEKVSVNRGNLGALQNRLTYTINNLGVTTENMTAAESRIRDTDMAKEMMAFTKNNVLAQAAQAMLAQANQQPQQVLQLLR